MSQKVQRILLLQKNDKLCPISSPPPPQPAVAGVIFAFVCENYRVHGFREVIGVGVQIPLPLFLKKSIIQLVKLQIKTPQTAPPPHKHNYYSEPPSPSPDGKTKTFLILACAATAHLCFILFIQGVRRNMQVSHTTLKLKFVLYILVNKLNKIVQRGFLFKF